MAPISNDEELKMSQPEHFEMLIIGSGEGGKYLAWHMAKSGHRTAVVERKLIGGSCPNTNCLPSKNEIWSAKVADLVRHADRFGIVTGSTATDMKRVLARKREMVDGREDPDVADAVLEMLHDDGIEVHLGVKVLRVQGRSGQTVSLQMRTPAGDQTVEGSDLLVAAGRTPNTDGIGLDLAGVVLDDRGYVAVNDRLETSAPDVWAIGEAAGSPQFTHVSFDDFRIISANLSGGNRTKRDRLVPYCMFTDPPLARVGLSEGEAQRQGIAVRVAKLPIDAVLRSRTISETRGFMKALVEAGGDNILGFTMIGAEAGEVMAVVQT